MPRFKSKHQAQNLRKHSWACIKCPAVYTTKQTACLECHNPVHYFPSKDELTRFRQLQLMQRAGQISELELQPQFHIDVKGQRMFTYRADFKYLNTEGEQVIEDVKGTTNEKHLDPVFKLKRKLVEAVHEISINITKVKK